MLVSGIGCPARFVYANLGVDQIVYERGVLMKLHLWLFFAGIVLACPGSVGLADDFKTEEGYTSLFNGKDLTGWRLGSTKLDGKTETKNKKWHVEKETIIIDGGGGG